MKQKKNFKLNLNKTTIADLSNLEMNALLGGLSGATGTSESMRLQTLCNECQSVSVCGDPCGTGYPICI